MQVRDETRTAFLRWRQHGDLRALTEVFDRTAQELLLVASHLAVPGQEPEDLLQETFLTAIGKADRYDAARPLEPWLLGILVNVTRSHRRRHQRERSLGDLEFGVDATEPVDTVLGDEFVRGLRAAIEGLPVPQREVMTLHLVHGLSATEIAHATARPVGTVKSWIHRSRDELRRRLPVGLLGTFASLLRGMGRLAEVRTVVQDAAVAGAGAGAVATGVSGARTAGSGWLAWLGAAVLLSILGAWWWRSASGVADPPAVTDPNVAATAGPALPNTPVAEREAAATTAAAAATDPASPATGTLTIRGVRGEQPFAFGGYVVDPGYPDAMFHAVSFETGADGTYRLYEMPYGHYYLQSDRGGNEIVVIDQPAVTQTIDFGSGVDVRGRVVDARGHGVAGASIEVTAGDSLEERAVIATADATGSFSVAGVEAGRFLIATTPGWLPSRFCNVPATPGAELELRLDNPGVTLDFDVVDASGAPQQGVRVQLGLCRPMGSGLTDKLVELRPSWVGVTDAAGHVRCPMAAVGETRLFARGPNTAAHSRMLTVPEGGGAVRIELMAGASIFGTIRAADGTPLPRCAVRAMAGDVPVGPTTPTFYFPICGTNWQGQYVLQGVAGGSVLVRARGPSAVPGIAERSLELEDGERLEWSPRITANGEAHGRLVDLPPGAAERLRIELRAPGARPIGGELSAEGVFRFGGLSERDFELVVLPRDAAADMILARRFPVRCGDAVELRLPDVCVPLGTLRGRMLDAASRSLSLDGRVGTFAKAANVDGSFVFDGLPPGDYHLVAGSGHQIRWHRDLHLAGGDVLDVGPISPEPMSAMTVGLAGASDANPVDLHVLSRDGLALLSFARLRSEPVAIELPPGSYQLLAWQEGSCVAAHDLELSLAPTSVQLEPRRGPVIALSAVPDLPVTSFAASWELHGGGRTLRFFHRRAAGPSLHGGTTLWIALEPGEYEVSARSGLGPMATTRFGVPLPPDQPPLRLRLR